MLPLNLTKHRNKHVPNAPYLFQRSGPARPIRSLLKSSVNQDRIDGIISPITILGTFLLAKNKKTKTLQQIASLWAGTRGLPLGKWNFLHALSQALKLKISMHPPRERAKKEKNPPLWTSVGVRASKTFTLRVILTSHPPLKLYLRRRGKIHRAKAVAVTLCVSEIGNKCLTNHWKSRHITAFCQETPGDTGDKSFSFFVFFLLRITNRIITEQF